MNIRNMLRGVMVVGCMAVAMAGLTACDDELEVQQAFPFTVELMPIPNKVTKGETVEIRCELVAEGKTDNTIYTIRYFQFEGEGTLKMDNGIIFRPNDRYLLENDKFRLYYTSECEEAQNFIVVVEDSFGNCCELEFDFNDDTPTELEETVPTAEGGAMTNGEAYANEIRYDDMQPDDNGRQYVGTSDQQNASV